jgi:hypothetical protein
MKPTLNDKLIAYLVLLSGLAISGIAEYYSIMGLMAIYPAAVIPIIVMGIALGIGKIAGTVWLKQNWSFAPWFLKAYILPGIIILMMITSLGVFGFLSKAHSDQNLVSGDVQSKLAIYDEKIKTAKDNIEANRKQLKQMDEAVDQIMGRSSDEKGADKANAVRKSQQRDRQALAKDIEANQKIVAQLNDEAAPIRAEVRKVEAEVGPIKYIAHLLYGENPDANILEKAVIWVTVLIVIVLDPLAVILLLASQYSFQRFREQDKDEYTPDPYIADVGEKPTTEEKTAYEEDGGPLTETQVEQIREIVKEDLPTGPVVTTSNLFESTLEEDEAFNAIARQQTIAEIVPTTPEPITVREESRIMRTKVFPRPSITVPLPETYVQNEEQSESNLWTSATNQISQEEYIAATRAKAGFDDRVMHMIVNVRDGNVKIEDVPADIRESVKAGLQ